MKFKSILAGSLVAVAFTACGPADPVQDNIVISAVHINQPLIGKTTTAGYFEVTNHANVDDALIGVESPIAERIEFHETKMVDGVMTMRRQVTIDLKAGETLEFKPGGYHLMLFGLAPDTDQVDAALTLKFKHAPDLTIIAEIGEMANHTGHD